jgi:hypothetical protein
MDKVLTLTLTEFQWKLVMKALDESVKLGGLNTAAHVLPIAFEVEKLIKPVKEEDKYKDKEDKIKIS